MLAQGTVTAFNVEFGMQKVLAMLRKAPHSVLPDPKVASMILDASGVLLARYSKKKFGEPHSEAQAVLNGLTTVLRRNTFLSSEARRQAAALLKSFRRQIRTPGSIRDESYLEELRRLCEILENPFRGCTMYVNLEPCSHFGKNPACAAIIAAAGLSEVHFAHFDPDPDVHGKGLLMLRDRGVNATVGCLDTEAMQLNIEFLQIASYLPKLFEGIHPTARKKDAPHLMLGLLVPPSVIRSRNCGKKIDVDTFGVPLTRTTIRNVVKAGPPAISAKTCHKLPFEPEQVLFTTLLNPPAIIEMLFRKFKLRPGKIIAALPDVSFELGKEECISVLREYCPRTNICVGVRMAVIKDKLARITLRRRLSVERDLKGKVAIIVTARGIPPHQSHRVETRLIEVISATTLHVSRLEEYLTTLTFLRDNIHVSIYVGGDVFAERWRAATVRHVRELLQGRPQLELLCTEKEAVKGFKAAGVPRVKYIEPYWELV